MDLHEISYDAGSQRMTGFLADGSAGRRVPGILVAHEGTGISEHTKERTAMLAELGYVVLAMDLFGETNLTPERSKVVVQSLRSDLPLLRMRANAGLDLLRKQANVDTAKVAAIGYCFGGTAVLELARSGAEVKGIVGFHSGLSTLSPQDARHIKARILVCLGADDPIILPAQRDAFIAEMSAAKVDWQMHLYGNTGHSFTNRWVDRLGMPGFFYNADADARSWSTMRRFLDEVFGT